MPGVDMNRPLLNDSNSNGAFMNKPALLDPEIFMCELKRNINELSPTDVRIPLQKLKIFLIKCIKIPISALPAGTKEPKLLTEFLRINPNHPNIK